MSNLRFRCLVDNDFCDIAPFEPYIEKGSSDMGLALIAFDESELDTIKSLLKEAQLEGSDGYLYILSQGSIEKKGKMPNSVMKAYRYYKRYKKKTKPSRRAYRERTQSQRRRHKESIRRQIFSL